MVPGGGGGGGLRTPTSASPSSSVLVLIFDRRLDPVTPLLNQWTYQAMIHDAFGIKNNVVEMAGKEGGKSKRVLL